MVDNSKNKNDFKKRNINMFSKSQKKVKRTFFSLIELLIVIGIMGALTALILPQFNNAEDSAKDGGCDYNNAGTLRYISMFRATNGVYPTGFHTGLNAAGDDTVTELEGGCDANGDDDTDDTAMAAATDENIMLSTATTLEALGAGSLASLQNAGIITAAYGNADAVTLTDTSVVAKITSSATTEWQDGGETLKIKGKALSTFVDADYDVIPLFVASTINWDTAFTGGSENGAQQDSPVQIALEGKCPWLGDGGFRYYICFFKVDKTGAKAAELIGTACPECGSLAATNF